MKQSTYHFTVHSRWRLQASPLFFFMICGILLAWQKATGGSVDITLYVENRITFIDLDGKMNTDNYMDLQNMILFSFPRQRRFIVNLKSVPRMDSGSLGSLVCVAQDVACRNGEIKLVCLNDKLRRIFKLANVERFFAIYEKTEDAVAAFNHSTVL